MTKLVPTLAVAALALGVLTSGCGDDEQEPTASAPSSQEATDSKDNGEAQGGQEGQANGNQPESAEALCLRAREEMLAGIVKVNEKYGSLSRDMPKNGVRAAQQAVVPTLEAMLEEADELQADKATDEVFAAIAKATEEVDQRNLSTQVPAFQEAFEPSSQLAREAGLEACAFVT